MVRTSRRKLPSSRSRLISLWRVLEREREINFICHFYHLRQGNDQAERDLWIWTRTLPTAETGRYYVFTIPLALVIYSVGPSSINLGRRRRRQFEGVLPIREHQCAWVVPMFYTYVEKMRYTLRGGMWCAWLTPFNQLVICGVNFFPYIYHAFSKCLQQCRISESLCDLGGVPSSCSLSCFPTWVSAHFVQWGRRVHLVRSTSGGVGFQSLAEPVSSRPARCSDRRYRRCRWGEQWIGGWGFLIFLRFKDSLFFCMLIVLKSWGGV